MGTAFDHELEDRFLHCVKIDTTAGPTSPTSPSTQIQFGLLNLLMDELKQIGAQDVTLTGYGAVLASIPATVQVAALRSGRPCAARLKSVRAHAAQRASRRANRAARIGHGPGRPRSITTA